MNKLKENIIAIIKSDDKRIKIAALIGLAGIILIMLSSYAGDSSSKNDIDKYESISYSDYAKELEKSLTQTISSIDGVGKCEVMITLENTKESVYATDNENKSDTGSVSVKDEYVLADTNGNEEPILIKEYLPKVQGVSIVCSGGDNAKVKESIINTVTSLFNISANRVSVSKIK